MHPDEVAIKTHADRLSLNVMPIKEHAKLMEDLEKPTLEYLVNKAAKYDSIVVTKDANTKLEKLAYSPDVKHMAEIADAKDLVVVNKEEFANITKLANEPHEDHIISKAKEFGISYYNESDHRELLQPSKSKLEQHASRIDHLLVPENEVHRLRDIESTPSREFIETKSSTT